MQFSFSEIKFPNGAHLKKRSIFFTYFSHILVTKERPQQIVQHISHLDKYAHILLTPLTFFAFPNFAKIANTSCEASLNSGMTVGVDSSLHHFGATNKYPNGEQNVGCNVYF